MDILVICIIVAVLTSAATGWHAERRGYLAGYRQAMKDVMSGSVDVPVPMMGRAVGERYQGQAS